ncbi:MAG: hypothetical protein WCP93_00865 [Candidatus Berkelbacteria bacterium]
MSVENPNQIGQFEPEESRSWDEQMNKTEEGTINPLNKTNEIPTELYYGQNKLRDGFKVEIGPDAENRYYETRAKRIIEFANQYLEHAKNSFKGETNEGWRNQLILNELNDMVNGIVVAREAIACNAMEKNTNISETFIQRSGKFDRDNFGDSMGVADVKQTYRDDKLMKAIQSEILNLNKTETK